MVERTSLTQAYRLPKSVTPPDSARVWWLCVALSAAACAGPPGPPESSVDFTSTSPFFVASEPAPSLKPKAPAEPAADETGEAASDDTAPTETNAPSMTAAASGAGATPQPSQGAAPTPDATATAKPAAKTAGAGAPAEPAPMMGSAGSGVMTTAPSPAMPMAGAGGGMSAAAGGSGATEPLPVEAPKATKLTVEFTTKTYGGRWAPDNVGAVWIADSRGRWIYTLEEWAGFLNHALNLVTYTGAGGPDYSAGLLPGTFTSGMNPPADVVAAATFHTHKAHKASWSFKDSSGKVVADGMYKLMFEMTEQETTDRTFEVPFMKGAPAGPVMAGTSPVIINVRIALQ